MSRSFARRPIGRSGVGVSPLCLGTMRLDRAGDADGAARIIAAALASGIETFHCSAEYETFPLLREAWARLGPERREAVWIGKLATPHFGEEEFSPAAFRSKVEYYLDALGLERLDVVQWLLRHDLKQEERRLAIFDEAKAAVADTVAALKREGKIGACVGFPYTAGIGAKLIEADFADGIVVYVNPLEHELDGCVAAAAEAGKAVVAIRPLAAGRIPGESGIGIGEALDYVFGHAAVATAVVSASSEAHLGELRGWFEA